MMRRNRAGGLLRRSAAFISVLLAMAPALSGCGASAPNAACDIVFNEVVSSNSRSYVDTPLGSPDWIELKNTTDGDIDLTGYRLINKKDSAQAPFAGITLPAGGHLVILAAKGKSQTAPGECRVDFNISKSGETLYLINPQGSVVTQLRIPQLPTDVSYARRSDGTYGLCVAPTPGGENEDDYILSADDIQARLAAGKLTVNEALPRPADGEDAWVELYNAGSADVDLAFYRLTDIESDPYKWSLPKRMLAAGQHAVVRLSGKSGNGGEMSASFRLGGWDNAIYLYDVTGSLVDSLSWQIDIPIGISAVAGGGYTAFPTPGSGNSAYTFDSIEPRPMDATDPVRLNEVLLKNRYSITDSDGDRPAWVELHNGSDMPVSLSGYYLSDNPADLFKWAFPDVKIEANGYILVFLSGKQGKADELHASFRLSERETGIFLTNLDGLRMDSLSIAGAPGENISVGRDDAGNPLYFAQPTPGSPNAVGFSDPALIGMFNKNGVYFSEVCAANEAKSGKNDWIELHNGSAEDVNLAGYYLSDDVSNRKKWRIDNLQIHAGGYAVIEATSDITQWNGAVAEFGISPSGETLLLSDANGIVVDAFETGALSVGITSGRIEGNDAVSRVYFTTPTCGKPNNGNALSGYTAKPIFSETGLYHSHEFELRISCATPGAKIYYTTDGSKPTSASKAYTGPLRIAENTPVRAVAYADGLFPSEITTATYLFEDPHTVPVFCITGQQRDMDVLINTDKRNYRPEFEVFVEYYETNGGLGVMFPAGVRPKGRSSLLNPQNSMTISLRSNYGQGSVTYPFFSGCPVYNFTDLVLRNAGQDHRNTRMRDPYFQTVAKGLNVDGTETKLVVAYINGVYCGVYDLCEDQNAEYAASHFGLDAKRIDMIERSSKVLSGDNKEFLRINEMARTWDTKDDKVFAEFAEYVDVDACIDYLITRIYFGDGDVQNMRFWRAQDYSVKWRPLLFDLDWSFRPVGVALFEKRDVFNKYFKQNVMAGNGTVTDNSIFCALMKNKAWCDKFTERFVQLAGTHFSPERMLRIFDDMLAVMEPEMQRHIDRWRTPTSMAVWQNETGKLRSAIEKRRSIVLDQLQRYFKVPEERMQELIAIYSAGD